MSEVPSRRCEESEDLAVYKSRIRIRVCIELSIAVWVGRDDM